MACDTCATSNSVLNEPFAPRSAVETQQMMELMRAQANYANCSADGKVLAFGITTSVAIVADGINSKTNSDPSVAAGIDFMVVQPFSKKNIKLHGIIIEAESAADLAALAIGEIQLDDGRDIRPRIKGTFGTQLTPATSLNCDGGLYKCGVDVLNAACLRPGNFNDPYEILISNDSGALITGVGITVLVEYFGEVD